MAICGEIKTDNTLSGMKNQIIDRECHQSKTMISNEFHMK